MFILQEPSRRWSKVHDDGVKMLPGDGGFPGSLCGILEVHVDGQVNGLQGTRWETAMNRLGAKFPVRTWIAGGGDFTGSWLEQRPDFSIVQSQETYATGVKPAKTRWNAKPGECATPLDIHKHLLQRSKATGWLGRHGQI